MTKLVLVTGASGFVGYQVLLRLAQVGQSMKLVIRKKIDLPNKVRKYVKKIVYSKNIFLESNTWWYEVFKDVDICIHLAWYLNHDDYLNSKINNECMNGTIAIAEYAKDSKLKKFVGIGTFYEYDSTEQFMSIDTKLNPNSLYGSCKAKTFLLVSEILKDTKTKFLWIRLFNLFGDREGIKRLYPYIKNQVSNKEPVEILFGDDIRDFMNVRDASKDIVDLALKATVGPVNVCSGKGISILEFVKKILLELKAVHLLKLNKSGNYIPKKTIGIKTITKND